MTPQRSLAARKMPGLSEFVVMMAVLMALTALSIDIMLPALPEIASSFGIAEANRQQLVVTYYMLGFALGQVVYGPLSDRFGRRGLLLFGLALYAAASLFCVIAGSFETLLGARFLQGIANAAPRVLAIAIVRDLYGGRRMAEVMSFIMIVFIIVPVLAPSLGGALLLVGPWTAIFGFLFVFAIITLIWMAARLPETRLEADREPLSFAWLGRALLATVTTRQTIGYTLATGAVFGSLLGYINSSQQIFTEVYAAGAWFPVLFGVVSLSLALASFVNSRLVGRFGMRRLSHGALIGFIAVSFLHWLIAYAWGSPLPIFVILLALVLFFFGFMMANFNALAMEPMGRIAGTASSFIGAVTTAIGAVLGWFVGQLYAGTVVPLLAGYVGFGCLALLAVLVTERGRLFHASQ